MNNYKWDFKVKDFDDFVKVNWSDLVEYAEEATGEQFSGQEPLLVKDEIIKIAKDIFDENIAWEKCNKENK